MGDQSQSGIQSELSHFLELRGYSLIDAGSAERGLNCEDAKAFLGMLLAIGVPLLGMEIWRKLDGRYRLNGLEVWYPIHEKPQLVHLDALEYLGNIMPNQNDVFTIQFGQVSTQLFNQADR